MGDSIEFLDELCAELLATKAGRKRLVSMHARMAERMQAIEDERLRLEEQSDVIIGAIEHDNNAQVAEETKANSEQANPL